MTKISIGADPEFFLEDAGKIISAHNLVPGTKKDPYKLPNGGAVQLDGTSVEFNIEPAYTKKQFADNIMSALTDIRRIVPKRYKFIFQPDVYYDKKEYDGFPDHSKELGCDPDRNAYLGVDGTAFNPVPGLYEEKGKIMRTGAGHIHIGWTKKEDTTEEDHLWDCVQVVRQLDYNMSNSLGSIEGLNKRRQMYGTFGSYRPKSYGVEYRVPANSWVGQRDSWGHIFELCLSAFNGCYRGDNVGSDLILAEANRRFNYSARYEASYYNYESRVYTHVNRKATLEV